MTSTALHRRHLLLRAATTVCALLTACVLASCGSGSTPAAADSTPSATPTTTAEAADVPGSPGPSTFTAGSKTLAVTVTGSTVTPAPTTVELPVGQTLALTVTSDHADEVHAHGFDVEKEVEAGGSVLLVLTGAEPGEYEVDMHDPVLTLLKIDVR
ncbi:hypothetical protein [Lapillicoccus jejuensis]|uniref:EfeO-type cupredoxin-like domain-containing protein n=1 Tax=Lapillicoccus jejuensis TaxID=402171 RepID=A0A542E2W2_9MICO|nr:hypothetical protein [Lapillicoccus jejuensis]TQJ09671.1 hypothetical protein FB458_2784 [Lapillicoccus jejuensis]